MRASIVAVVTGLLVGALMLSSRAGSSVPPPRDELLLFVIGGSYATRTDALAASAAMPFGDVQGFYVIDSDDLIGETPGRWLLVSAFRTVVGAAGFEELANAAGIGSPRRTLTRYRGTDEIGLGQEPHPDGSGPLLFPLPPDHPSRLREGAGVGG